MDIMRLSRKEKNLFMNMTTNNLIRFLSEENGKIFVDWEEVARYRRKIFLEIDHATWQSQWESFLDVLVERNILTYSLESSWTLVGGGFEHAPKKPAPSSQLYFTRREDAEKYKEHFCSNLVYGVSIKSARETI